MCSRRRASDWRQRHGCKRNMLMDSRSAVGVRTCVDSSGVHVRQPTRRWVRRSSGPRPHGSVRSSLTAPSPFLAPRQVLWESPALRHSVAPLVVHLPRDPMAGYEFALSLIYLSLSGAWPPAEGGWGAMHRSNGHRASADEIIEPINDSKGYQKRRCRRERTRIRPPALATHRMCPVLT